MRASRATVALTAAALFAVGPAGWADPEATAVLRPGVPALPAGVTGSVVSVTPAGVAVSALGGARVIAWDVVSQVSGSGPRQAEAGGLSELADRVWRGRIRVERGDWGGAEAALRPLATHPGLEGPTGVLVWEGLLRCEVARGASDGAVRAWIIMLGTLERGSVPGAAAFARPADWIGGRIAGAPVIDPQTGLAPALPPMWLGESAVEASARDSAWLASLRSAESEPNRTPIARELAEIYTAAARFDAGLGFTLDPPALEHPGLRLARLVVLARVGNAEARLSARASLATIAKGPDQEPWIAAWCHAAVGRSLIRETAEASRIEGVLSLLTVASDPAPPVPHLVAICLAEAARAMRELKDDSTAGVLKRELLDRFPSDSAARWSELGSIVTAPPAATAGAVDDEAETSRMIQPGGKRP